MIIFIIGFIAATFSGVYLLISGVRKKTNLWRSAKTIYLFVAALEFYHAIIYSLVIFGILATTQYGAFLRPIVSMYVLAPALIAIVHRGEFKKII